MPLHFKSVTEVPVPIAPSQGGLCAWSEDNVVAFCSQRTVTMLHARRLQEGQMTAILDLGDALPYIDRPNGENSPHVNMAAIYSTTYKNHDDRRLYHDLAKAIAWTPSGLAPDGGCILVVVHVSGQVMLFARPATTRDVVWPLLHNVSEQLSVLLMTAAGTAWLETLVAPAPSGRLRGGAGPPAGPPSDDSDVEVLGTTRGSPQPLPAAVALPEVPAAVVVRPASAPQPTRAAQRLQGLQPLAAQPRQVPRPAAARPAAVGPAAAPPAAVVNAPTRLHPAAPAAPQPASAAGPVASKPAAPAASAARRTRQTRDSAVGLAQGAAGGRTPTAQGAGASASGGRTGGVAASGGGGGGRGKKGAASGAAASGGTGMAAAVAGGSVATAQGGGGAGRGRKGGKGDGRGSDRGGSRGRGASTAAADEEEAVANTISAHTDLATPPEGSHVVAVEPLPEEVPEGDDLVAAVAERLVMAFHALHQSLSEADFAAVAAPYLKTSCRRIPLALKKPHEKLAAHAAAAVFHACRPQLATRSGDDAWTAERILDDLDLYLRNYVHMACWVRRYPLKSGKFHMREVSPEAEQLLDAQAVAAVWLRMLENMHARESAIVEEHGAHAVPADTLLAEDSLHQALSEFFYMHALMLARYGVQFSDISRPIRCKIRTLFRGGGAVERSDMRGRAYVAPRSTTAVQLVIAAPERWPELRAFVSGDSGDSEGGGGGQQAGDAADGDAPGSRRASGDSSVARPEPTFQEPSEVVPAALVPPRDAPPALLDNPDTPDVAELAASAAARSKPAGNASNPSAPAAAAASGAAAAAAGPGSARRSSRARKTVVTNVVDISSSDESGPGSAAGDVDSDATIGSDGEEEEEDLDDDGDDCDGASSEGLGSDGDADSDASALDFAGGGSGGEGEGIQEIDGSSVWKRRKAGRPKGKARRGGRPVVSQKRAVQIISVKGERWDRARNGKLPAGYTAADFPEYSLAQHATLHSDKADKAERIARVYMTISEALTPAGARMAAASPAARALSTRLLMTTCVAAAFAPCAAADEPVCCVLAAGTRAGHVLLWRMHSTQEGAAAVEGDVAAAAPCTLAGFVDGCALAAAGRGTAAGAAGLPRLPPVTAVAWAPGEVRVAVSASAPPAAASILLVATARGGVSAFAVTQAAPATDTPASPYAGTVPGGAALRAVPLGVVIAPGVSPAAQLTAQLLCAADVPSLQHPQGTHPPDDSAVDGTPSSGAVHADGDADADWRTAFPGQAVTASGPQVLAVAMGNSAGEVALCCRVLPAGVVLRAADGLGDAAAAFSPATAAVRPACMACTTGLAITATGMLCATFGATFKSLEAVGGHQLCSWQIHCTAGGVQVQEGGGESVPPLRCWLEEAHDATMPARPLLPHGMLSAQPRPNDQARAITTFATGLATAPGGLFIATVAHSMPHRSISNPGSHRCGMLQLRRTFTFRPPGDAHACTRQLCPAAPALRAALRAALRRRRGAAAPLPAAAVWEAAAAVVEGLACDFEALAVDLETAAVEKAAGKEELQALERELEKSNAAAAAEALRKPEVEQAVLARHAVMVDAVWDWLAGGGSDAAGGAEDERSPTAHSAQQVQVACGRIAYALAELSFGPVKIMHAAPACFDSGSGNAEQALRALQERLAPRLAAAETSLLQRHLQAALAAPAPNCDAEAAAGRLLLCDAVACMAAGSMPAEAPPVPSALVEAAREIFTAAGESMEDPRPQREQHTLLDIPLTLELTAPANPSPSQPAVPGVRYAVLDVGAARCTVPRCGATLSANPDAGGPRCCACMQPYPCWWQRACVYCGTRLLRRGVVKQLDVPTLL
eukprot:jgi/Ulvmu1/6833/UM031_0037.1